MILKIKPEETDLTLFHFVMGPLSFKIRSPSRKLAELEVNRRMGGFGRGSWTARNEPNSYEWISAN